MAGTAPAPGDGRQQKLVGGGPRGARPPPRGGATPAPACPPHGGPKPDLTVIVSVRAPCEGRVSGVRADVPRPASGHPLAGHPRGNRAAKLPKSYSTCQYSRG